MTNTIAKWLKYHLFRSPLVFPVIRCPNIPLSGNRWHACTYGVQGGSQCTFTCHRGYRLIGGATVNCNSNTRRWSSSFPTCQGNTLYFILNWLRCIRTLPRIFPFNIVKENSLILFPVCLQKEKVSQSFHSVFYIGEITMFDLWVCKIGNDIIWVILGKVVL